MHYTLLHMFALIGMGLLWSWRNPSRTDNTVVRRVLTDTVYYIFLPALVFNVLWQAELGLDSIKIAAAAACAVFSALLLSWLICKRCNSDHKITGAVLLAASFPNATYLGYPLLVNTLGDWAGAVAIQFDLFACTPILLTVGIMMSAHYGKEKEKPHPILLLIKVPPLWAALIATLLNLMDIPPNKWLIDLASMLGSAVIPIMLFAIGLALKQGFHESKHLFKIIPVIFIQLLFMPLFVLLASLILNIEGDLRSAVILEAAMPSMALGVVLCDRYNLNTGLYAAAVTATTLLSLITLPIWFALI